MSRSSATRTDGVALGDVLEFMRQLWAMEHGLQKLSKRMARGHGVTGPQRLVLRLVSRFPGISPGELAVLLSLHPSTLTGVLERLSSRTLVERRPHASDGRRSVLFLTPAGRRVVRPTNGTVEDAVQRVLRAVGPRRLAAARQVLAQLAVELEHDAAERVDA